MKFTEITAQKRVADYMQRATASRRLSHAYILDGERGMGKRTLAEAFAAALLCLEGGKDADGACGQCRSCRQIASGSHPDIIYVTHEKKHLTVEDIREQIVSTVDIRPYQSEYKIYIVDDAGLMTIQAQNALLKSLEEPPPYIVMLLLADNAGQLLETIRSRCATLTLTATPDHIVREIVRKKSDVPDYRVEACIAFAQGNVGKALLLVEDEGFEELKETTFSLMGKMDKISDINLMDAAESIEDVEEFLDLLLIYFKDMLVYKTSGSRDALVLSSQAYHITRWADNITDVGAGLIPAAIAAAREKLAANANKSLILENLLFALKDIRIHHQNTRTIGP